LGEFTYKILTQTRHVLYLIFSEYCYKIT